MLPSDCGVADVELTQPLIQNGMPTEKGDWPWLVALFLTKDNTFFCAGSLVDLTHVVTGTSVAGRLRGQQHENDLICDHFVLNLQLRIACKTEMV